MERQILPNPFPGLRPYGPDEEHLFFGREKEIEAILRRLRAHRFLPVIGTSGCGKSSLVRSGLIPSLESGLMVAAGSSWRIALMRPGEDPIGHLAAALDGVLDERNDELASTNRVLIDATLRRGSLGLVAAIRQARLKPDDNVLVVVDQFEELFRFRHSRQTENSRDEAVAFVKLLLEAAQQSPVPIYVVLTMRSDFIGDCMEFPGLPEAINQSHYLVPRMSRDALRSVITGPVAVGGGEIAPRLVLRLLNDLGDNQDELPLLQHVLMRMWEHWQKSHAPGQPIDIDDYLAVGTLRDALSRHAEEAYAETGEGTGQKNTERIFKALTDTFTDARGIRRPTTVGELAAICEIREAEVVRIVETFRREGRSFLMPPPLVPLTSRTIVDISHESLMRGWSRLIAWAHEERTAATVYARLSREATWYAEGAAALWGDPELELGLRWRNENKPTAAWAQRFDDNFERAIDFLDKSEHERTQQRLERRTMRLRRLQVAWGAASVLLVMLALAVWQWRVARSERDRASMNFDLATSAVDELLASVEQNQSAVGSDVPQMEQFRSELLAKAQGFYTRFLTEDPGNQSLMEKQGQAHFRLGHIHRMLEDGTRAAADYQESIRLFESLVARNPDVPQYKRELASAFNWIGETYRTMMPDKFSDAEAAYGRALSLQEELLKTATAPEYQQELARTRYNRGILYSGRALDAPSPDAEFFKKSEDDLREAIRLLESVAGRQANNRTATQELGRVFNNLAGHVGAIPDRRDEAKTLYARAVSIHEGLKSREPRNREYKYELAKFLGNQAELLRESGDLIPAHESSDYAIKLYDDLARQPSRLGIDRADAFNLRGRILFSEGLAEAVGEFRQALKEYKDLDQGVEAEATRLPEYHLRFGDFLMSLGEAQQSSTMDVRNLLDEAVGFYGGVGVRIAQAGLAEPARLALDNLSLLRDRLGEPERASITTAIANLEKALPDGASPR